MTASTAQGEAQERGLAIVRLIRDLRSARRANRSMAVLAYTDARGVLAGVERPGSELERALSEVIAEREAWRDGSAPPLSVYPLVPFEHYEPEDFRAPMPPDKGERRLAHGLLSNLGSRLVVPSPVGVAAVYFAGGRTRFAAAGVTPGVARLLRGVLPLLREVRGWRDQWFRANARHADLVDPAERGPLAPFIDESEAAADAHA
jgi:hypothetical protein